MPNSVNIVDHIQNIIVLVTAQFKNSLEIAMGNGTRELLHNIER